MENFDIKLFEKLDDDEQVNEPLIMEVGEFVVMRGLEREDCVEVGDLVTVYKIIKVKDTGFEAMPDVYRLI